MGRALVLEGPRQVALHEQSSGAVAPGEARLRTLVSAISHGTELSLYRGTSPFEHHRFDRELRAMVPIETASPGPQPLGYELIGVVEELGAEVEGLRVGDVVHAGAPHGEGPLIDVAAARASTYPLVTLPPTLAHETALYASVGAVALTAVHDANPRVGDDVAIVGLGAIGLLTVQLVRRAGARRVFALDPDPSRRELALALGADVVLDPFAEPEGAGLALKRANSGRGVDVAIEISGTDAGLHDAIAAAGLGCTVVAVGFYQGGAPRLRLGEEFGHNRITLLSSMGAWGAPHRAHPAWDRTRIMETVLGLLAVGELRTDLFPLRRFPFADAPAAYRWLDEHSTEAIKVVLAYEDADPHRGEKA